MKVTKDRYHVRLEVDGAAFALPIEVIKGIKTGEIDDLKYYHAAEFLEGESGKYISVEDVRSLFEEAVQ